MLYTTIGDPLVVRSVIVILARRNPFEVFKAIIIRVFVAMIYLERLIIFW